MIKFNFNKKEMKKTFILLFIILVWINFSYAWNVQVEDEVKNIVKTIPQKEENTVLDVIAWWNKNSLSQLVSKDEEEKNIETMKDLVQEISIKKDFSNELLAQTTSKVEEFKNQVELNSQKISQISQISQISKLSSEQTLKLEDLKKENDLLKKQIASKSLLINDLESTINNYSILQTKYESLLNKYVWIKKTAQDSEKENTNKKMFILYFVLTLFGIIYLIKFILYKKYSHKYEKWLLYFDLIFWITAILTLIFFFFYIHPELYIVLVFISGYIIFINASIIWSFISSLIVIEKFAIWDVIEHENSIWKITRITPIFTIVRTMNKHWILTNKIISIPNLMLVKDKVNIVKEPSVLDREFSVILSLKDTENIFKLIDDIKDDILLKNLTRRMDNINLDDTDIFKVDNEQIDVDKIKVNFYWRATNTTSRKIERKILGFLKSKIEKLKLKNEKNFKKDEEDSWDLLRDKIKNLTKKEEEWQIYDEFWVRIK